MILIKKGIWLALFSSCLIALAYPGWGFGSTWLTTGGLGWLAWFGLVPFFYGLARTKRPFWFGSLTGLVYFLIIFRWFWSIYPLDTLGIESRLASIALVLLIYLVSAAGMAVFWGLFALVARRQGALDRFGIISIPAIFVLFEYARAWGFGFLWLGSGSLAGPHWTQGSIAYALAENALALQLASYVGIYGVVFLVVLANVIFHKTLSANTQIKLLEKNKIPLVIVVAAVIIFLPKLFWSDKNQNTKLNGNKPPIKYALIQTGQATKINLQPQEAVKGFKTQLELLDQVAKEHPETQIIAFPEDSDFFKNISLFLTPAQVKQYFTNLFNEPRLIISGGRTLDAETNLARSRVYSLDTQGDIIGFYDKRLLTPGGEFLPYPLRLAAKLASKTTVSSFDSTRELSVGDKATSTVGFRYEFNAAPIVCSELLSPQVAKNTTNNADIVVSMASYGVFHGSETIAKQMLAATRFRAAENARPIITAANMGRSYAIDNRGSVVNLATNSSSQILTGTVAPGSERTWYNKLGDYPVLLGSLVLGILGIKLKRPRDE